MGIYELICKRRTIRKFKQIPIEREVLEKLANAARIAPSASNLQPLKYALVYEPEMVKRVFGQVKWAGYITPYGNPGEGEEPTAYIAVLVDTEVRKNGYESDVGAAVENIILAALEEDIGACWMGAIDREAIRSILSIPDRYIINAMVALGYPSETPQIEDENGSIKYYKDDSGVLHVPKRKLKDIIIN